MALFPTVSVSLHRQPAASSSVRFTLQGRLGNQLFTCHAAAYAHLRWQQSVELLAAPGDRVADDVALLLGPPLRLRRVPGLTFEGEQPATGWPARLSRALRRHRAMRTLRPHWVEGPQQRPESLLEQPPGPWRGFTGHFQISAFTDWLHERDHRPVRLPTPRAALPAGTCAVHIRLTDYRTVPGAPLLTRSYYAQAWQALAHRSPAPVVMLFSDEPETALPLLRSALPAGIAERIVCAPELPPVETMALMATATSLIAANSSFSWWAGRLSTTIEAVTVPWPWFVEDPMSGLYPTGWVRIPAGFGATGAGVNG